MLSSQTNRWRIVWLALALAVVLLALLLIPRAAGAQPSSAEANSIARGQQLAQQLCARCHAIGKADVSPNPKAPALRDIGKLYPLDHLAEAFAEGITTGDNDMPQYKFGPRDIDAIIDFMAEMSVKR